MTQKILEVIVKEDKNRALSFINKNKISNEIRDTFGRNALHLAAERGFNEIIQILIEKYGFNIEDNAEENGTALIDAAACGQVSTVKFLLDIGANINATDSDELSSLHWAIEEKELEVVEILIKYVQKNNDKRLLSIGLNLNTPLHCLMLKENIPIYWKMIHLLIENGADINAINNEGMTPLHLAAENGDVLNCIYLIQKGALSNIKNSKEKTPYELALEKNHLTLAAGLKECMEKKFDKSIVQYKILLANYPAEKLLAYRLSPSISYLRDSVLPSARIQESETYWRSEKHPLSNKYKNLNHFHYKIPKINLENGQQAHVGNYGNLMQILGDTFQPNTKPIRTSSGTGNLYERLLDYKNNICKYISEKFNHDKNISLIKVGFYNNYPCIMVHVKQGSISKAPKTKKPSEAAFEGWVNLLASFYLGLVNYYAIKENYPIEIERRASFGFLTPTIAIAGSSIRINVGLIPIKYADILIKSLKNLEEVLKNIKNGEFLAPISNSIFYKSEAHIKYLNKKYNLVEVDNLIQLLWVQSEISGKTTVQNMVRTAYARDGISIKVFESLKKEDVTKSFFAGIEWALSKIQVVNLTPSKFKMSFQQDKSLLYSAKFCASTEACKDGKFWSVIDSIVKSGESLNSLLIQLPLDNLKNCIKTKKIDKLYSNLELLNEQLFMEAIITGEMENNADGYGSDSEEESEDNQSKIFAKKIIVHNGMRAIWLAIITAAKFLENNNLKPALYLDKAYYEVKLGLKNILILHEIPHFTEKKCISASNLILKDINACITDGQLTKEYELSYNQILILDGTSSTVKDVQPYIDFFIKSRIKLAFLVESGFKNQQLGADKNQYGTIRIFAKDKKLRDDVYLGIKKIEPPLLSPTAHSFRRKMKALGAVPVTRNFINRNNPPRIKKTI
ncbi:MAG: hypothetical protein JWM09_1255 [Francisellaceae bacterium]|nr:hypothetical protein [Francisellaceae bacterium]